MLGSRSYVWRGKRKLRRSCEFTKKQMHVGAKVSDANILVAVSCSYMLKGKGEGDLIPDWHMGLQPSNVIFGGKWYIVIIRGRYNIWRGVSTFGEFSVFIHWPIVIRTMIRTATNGGMNQFASISMWFSIAEPLWLFEINVCIRQNKLWLYG